MEKLKGDIMKSLKDTFTLSNGCKINIVGFGTWRAPEGDVTSEAVCEALRVGYRHIDTAKRYENEKSVGRGIKMSGVPREEIFVTSKVWNTDRGYDNTLRAFEKSLSDLDLDYLDLYLIHWPAVAKQFDNWKEINRDTWRALVKLYKEGRIRSIGVSNFREHHLDSLMDSEIVPMVNQIEFHPGFMQKETVRFCQENNVLVEGWATFGAGEILENETLLKIAAKYNKTTAQLCLRWSLQHGVLPLMKSTTPSRIADNARIFDFEIEKEDMDEIDSMAYCGGAARNPDEINF